MGGRASAIEAEFETTRGAGLDQHNPASTPTTSLPTLPLSAIMAVRCCRNLSSSYSIADAATLKPSGHQQGRREARVSRLILCHLEVPSHWISLLMTVASVHQVFESSETVKVVRI